MTNNGAVRIERNVSGSSSSSFDIRSPTDADENSAARLTGMEQDRQRYDEVSPTRAKALLKAAAVYAALAPAKRTL
jgi:hypothetical protein